VQFLLVALGLVILLLAGDSLVRGAVNAALRLGVPALIVGLTIVAFGTSAPELLVSIQAISDGAPGIALGNVVGSNIANILLVLGIPALISGIRTGASDTRKSYVMMIAASVFFIGLAFYGPITWVHGLALLAFLAAVLTDQVREALAFRRNGLAETEEVEGADPSMPWWKIGLFTGLGLVGLPLGADLLVDNSVSIARQFGVSETVIGLTLVAVGTSLPELATTVMAAIRKSAGGRGAGQRHRLEHVQPARHRRGGKRWSVRSPSIAQFLTFDLWVMLAASILHRAFRLLHDAEHRVEAMGASCSRRGSMWPMSTLLVI
jgi:cation:H+ antiporter